MTEELDYGGGRQVAVYLPPEPAEAVVFAADGGWHVPLPHGVSAVSPHKSLYTDSGAIIRVAARIRRFVRV
ncbi:MAG: hypothetical protein QM713_11085 [Arachnia sp.]